MSKMTKGLPTPALLAVFFVLVLILVAAATSASGDVALNAQVTLTCNDQYGQGTSTVTVFYGIPTNAQVGSNLTVPFKMSVVNLTRLMTFLSSYNVTIFLGLSNGKVVSGTVGVSGTQAAENLGSLQLHQGQAWGPINITLPLTQAKTGLSQGQEALANITLRVNEDIYYNQPINGFRQFQNQTSIGYMIVANGTPAGPEPNYAGLALLGFGVILVAVSFVTRTKRPDAVAEKKASAGSV